MLCNTSFHLVTLNHKLAAADMHCMCLVCSNYHVELNPSDVGNNDRYVVQEIIKELAKNRPLDVAGE